MLAYRLMHPGSFKNNRSFCPKCEKPISWYDNIPVISYIILKARCRTCKTKISLLYPFIEVFTALTLFLLYLELKKSGNLIYLPAYFTLFSALIVTFRTDLEFMLISRFMTLFLIPFGLLFSAIGLLPITFIESLLGACLGYGVLFLISKVFYLTTKKEGIGLGDLELLAFIGSFLGISGCWISLFLGSIIGSIYGIAYIIITRQARSTKMPFGHFLAIGAILFVLFDSTIRQIIF